MKKFFVDLSVVLKQWRFWLVVIVFISIFTRYWRLTDIHEYIFDEVYHAFTAKMYALNRYEAWVWWESPPAGVAYEWTHPPLAKVIMSWGVTLFGGPGSMPDVSKPQTLLANWSLGWRFFPAFFGVLATYALFLLTKSVFKNAWVGILAAFLFTFDLLPLVQSRTAMNDIFAVTFLLFSFYFFTKRSAVQKIGDRETTLPSHLLNYQLSWQNWILTGIFLGCSIASKWTALFTIGLFSLYQGMTILYFLIQKYVWVKKENSVVKNVFYSTFSKTYLSYIGSIVPKQIFVGGLCLLLLPFVIYLLSYWQLFTITIDDYKGNNLTQFLQNYQGQKAGIEGQVSEVSKNMQGLSVKSAEYDTLNESKKKTQADLFMIERDHAIFSFLNPIQPYMADRLFIWWGLQKQMWWYHTNLKATHNYTSQWWTWPLDIRPVWFYVKYCTSADSAQKDVQCKQSFESTHTHSTIADVYTMGNPLIFWFIFPTLAYVAYPLTGKYRVWFYALTPALIIFLFQYIFNYQRGDAVTTITSSASSLATSVLPQFILFAMLLYVFLVLISFIQTMLKIKNEKSVLDKQHIHIFMSLFIFFIAFSGYWLPWARSPRIMFFYHFFPPMTFFYPLLAYSIYSIYSRYPKLRTYVFAYLLLVALSFSYFYPHVTGKLMPEKQRENYYWIKSWK